MTPQEREMVHKLGQTLQWYTTRDKNLSGEHLAASDLYTRWCFDRGDFGSDVYVPHPNAHT
jgi:hypothetical protein